MGNPPRRVLFFSYHLPRDEEAGGFSSLDAAAAPIRFCYELMPKKARTQVITFLN
jgi:hypothetical protein